MERRLPNPTSEAIRLDASAAAPLVSAPRDLLGDQPGDPL